MCAVLPSRRFVRGDSTVDWNRNDLLRFAVVVAAAVAIWRLAQAASLHGGADPSQAHLLFAGLVCPASLALIALALRWHGRGPRWLGLHGQGAGRAVATGLLAYLLPAALTLALCLATGLLSMTPQVPMAELLPGIALVVVLVFAGEALPEELLFRGYAWACLSRVLSTWQVILAQAVLFVLVAAAMGAVDNALDASFLFTFGVVLGVLRAATGSLWAPMAFHLAFMVAQQATGRGRLFFAVDKPELLTVVMAMVPFSIAIIWLHRRVAWTAPARVAAGERA